MSSLPAVVTTAQIGYVVPSAISQVRPSRVSNPYSIVEHARHQQHQQLLEASTHGEEKTAMFHGKRPELSDRDPGQSLESPDESSTDLGYERLSLLLQVRDEVEAAMAARQITQAQLAKAMGVTEGRVSQILSADQNLTVKTLASLAAAVGAHLKIELVSASPLLEQDARTMAPAHTHQWAGSVARPRRQRT